MILYESRWLLYTIYIYIYICVDDTIPVCRTVPNLKDWEEGTARGPRSRSRGRWRGVCAFTIDVVHLWTLNDFAAFCWLMSQSWVPAHFAQALESYPSHVRDCRGDSTSRMLMRCALSSVCQIEQCKWCLKQWHAWASNWNWFNINSKITMMTSIIHQTSSIIKLSSLWHFVYWASISQQIDVDIRRWWALLGIIGAISFSVVSQVKSMREWHDSEDEKGQLFLHGNWGWPWLFSSTIQERVKSSWREHSLSVWLQDWKKGWKRPSPKSPGDKF